MTDLLHSLFVFDACLVAILVNLLAFEVILWFDPVPLGDGVQVGSDGLVIDDDPVGGPAPA